MEISDSPMAIGGKMSGRFWATYWTAVAGGLAGAAALAWWYAPTEATMGVVQKIFYLHLPVAINTLLACGVVFVASLGYLWRRRLWWDDLASAAGKVAVLGASLVLATGMMWGHVAWGVWWTWSPRLTFSLVLWLLYVVYLVTRASVEGAQRRALVAAVYGVLAFLDVPLVYLSAKLMPDIHPASITLAGPMQLTLAAWGVVVTAALAGLMAARFELAQRQRKREKAGDEGAEEEVKLQGVAV